MAEGGAARKRVIDGINYNGMQLFGKAGSAEPALLFLATGHMHAPDLYLYC